MRMVFDNTRPQIFLLSIDRVNLNNIENDGYFRVYVLYLLSQEQKLLGAGALKNKLRCILIITVCATVTIFFIVVNARQFCLLLIYFHKYNQYYQLNSHYLKVSKFSIPIISLLILPKILNQYNLFILIFFILYEEYAYDSIQYLLTTSIKLKVQVRGQIQMEKRYEILNISAVFCYTSHEFIVIVPNLTSQKEKANESLIINRKTSQITASPAFDYQKYLKRNFSAFIGIASIEQQNFAVFCDQVKPACTVNTFLTYQISSLFFLSFTDEKKIKKMEKRKSIYSKIRDLNVLLTSGFYFSHEYNLTRTLQYQKFNNLDHFVWNNIFLKPLFSFPKWQTPVIQGFVSQFQIFIQGTKIFYILISRRSIKKGGTRFFDRGMNDEGYVANFVQTQQIVKINKYLMSDLQIRGNVPIFFQQTGLTTKVKLSRGYQLTHQIYIKHIQKLTKSYERVFWVNLLCQRKKGQMLLIKQLQKHVRQDNNKNIKYFFYDFHKVTGHTQFEKVDEGIQTIQNLKKALKFYIYDSQKNQVIMRQQGVFRTNCLDCLDRTNFFQSKLAMVTFEQILSCFQIVFDQPMVKVMNDPNEDSSQIVNFRNIWANNGDKVSYHYTGTGSTHTDIIRDGKRGFFGIFKHKYKSVARFYNQNFWDFYKMRLVDQLLHEKTSQMETQTIPTLVQERQAQFCEKKIADIYIFSWKSPKKIPTSIPLFPNTHDIISINIQQMSEDEKWKFIINQSIDQNLYILVSQKISSHNLLMIYCKKQLKDAITNVQTTKVKFKSLYNQILSNKCAILIRFQLYNTIMTFVGCQLQFGKQYSSYRLSNLKDIHKFAFQQAHVGEKQSEPILQDDVIFLFGNMNTNISNTYRKTIVDQFSKNPSNIGLQHRRLISQIIQSDQFQEIQQNLLQYRFYEQEQVKFGPTYKYHKSRGEFDGESSGWPDRIWYSTEKKIICSKYSTLEQLRDQHVPVYAVFQMEVQIINQEAKEAVSQQIFERFSQTKGYLQNSDKIDSFEEIQ